MAVAFSLYSRERPGYYSFLLFTHCCLTATLRGHCCSLSAHKMQSLSAWGIGAQFLERGLNASTALESHKLKSGLYLPPRQQLNVSVALSRSPRVRDCCSVQCSTVHIRVLILQSFACAGQVAGSLPQTGCATACLGSVCPVHCLSCSEKPNELEAYL